MRRAITISTVLLCVSCGSGSSDSVSPESVDSRAPASEPSEATLPVTSERDLAVAAEGTAEGSADTSTTLASTDSSPEGLGPLDELGLPTTDAGVEFVRERIEGRSGESRLVEISFCGVGGERPQEPGTFETTEWSEYEPADGKFASIYRVEDPSKVVDAWRDAARNANDVGGCGTDWVVEETSSGLSVNDNWYVVTTDAAWVWTFSGDEPQTVLRLLNLDRLDRDSAGASTATVESPDTAEINCLSNDTVESVFVGYVVEGFEKTGDVGELQECVYTLSQGEFGFAVAGFNFEQGRDSYPISAFDEANLVP